MISKKKVFNLGGIPLSDPKQGEHSGRKNNLEENESTVINKLLLRAVVLNLFPSAAHFGTFSKFAAHLGLDFLIFVPKK